jgi:flagellar export protein FliJ
MYNEYANSINASDTPSLGMREAMNQRQFMSQLLTLLQRVRADIDYTDNAMMDVKERLIAAERERIKMQTLADQNAQAVRKAENTKDQRRMDTLGVMQFNLKSQA